MRLAALFRRSLPLAVASLGALVTVSAAAPATLLAQPTSAAPATPSPAALPAVALPPELDRVLRDYERAWRARDAAALAALFTDDGFALASSRPPVRGTEALRAHYTGQGGPLHLTALAWAADGDVGYVVGQYAGAPDAAPDGKFVLALRRVDGRWRIAADMDNASRPPQRRAAPVSPPLH